VKPIGDHAVQQRKFKERYADQKAIGQIEWLFLATVVKMAK
jgi:hypothetical protein